MFKEYGLMLKQKWLDEIGFSTARKLPRSRKTTTAARLKRAAVKRRNLMKRGK